MSAPKLQHTPRRDRSVSDKIAYLERVLGVPFTYGNQIRVLQNGDEIFPAMLEAISAAQSSINFATYVYWQGDVARAFAAALTRRARAGVTVRVLLDAIGASKMSDGLVETMEQAGVQVRWFRPFRKRFWDVDKRTHRKLLICDQAIAFTGGVGIAEEWEGNARDETEWRESHFAFGGPCVSGFDGSFWDDWFEMEQDSLRDARAEVAPPAAPLPFPDTSDAAVQVISSSPSTHQSTMERAFVAMLWAARQRVRIVTPYFVLQRRFVDLLIERVRQGVSIEIILPGPHIDRRFERFVTDEFLEDLINAGVAIWRFQPTMIHSKIWLLDDDLACVGSPNLNQRSRKKDDEAAAMICDQAIVDTLGEAFERDKSRSRRVRVEDIGRANLVKRAVARFCLLFREQI